MKNTNKNTINMNNNKSDSENSNNFNKYFTSIGAEINNRTLIVIDKYYF